MILTKEELKAIWYVMLSIKLSLLLILVQLPDLLSLNEEMFFWIFANKEAIEEVFSQVSKGNETIILLVLVVSGKSSISKGS